MAVPGYGGIGRSLVGGPVRRLGWGRRNDGCCLYRGLGREQIVFAGMLVPVNLLAHRFVRGGF